MLADKMLAQYSMNYINVCVDAAFSGFCRKCFYAYSQKRSQNYQQDLFVQLFPFLCRFHQSAPYASRCISMDPLSGSQLQPLYHPIQQQKNEILKTTSQPKQLLYHFVILTLLASLAPGRSHADIFDLISAKSTFFVVAKSSKNLL